jgi:hypothetical protein
MIRRRRWHQAVFTVAGLYNIGWWILSAVHPQWMFEFSGMTPINHPAIFACLGMVIGLYGILYLEVARVPERGWLLAAVGLTGKVLGPLGWLQLYLAGEWPLASGILCLTNDVMWWAPFTLYLIDAWSAKRDH